MSLSLLLILPRYATVAKRVNVKKLKHDLWSHLEDSLAPASGAGAGAGAADTSGGGGSENDAPSGGGLVTIEKNKISTASANANASGGAELSFQNVINDISHGQGQKDVSLSFYFICLLHLANEKVSFVCDRFVLIPCRKSLLC
jgi:condensin complex subunit 2